MSDAIYIQYLDDAILLTKHTRLTSHVSRTAVMPTECDDREALLWPDGLQYPHVEL